MYVTPLERADIWIDRGPNVPSADRYRLVADDVEPLGSVTITDPVDDNLSGAIVFAVQYNEGILSRNPVDIVLAWGQDPLRSDAHGFYGLDAGHLIPGNPLLDSEKSSRLFIDADGDGTITPGDVLLYTIAVFSMSESAIPGSSIFIRDALPQEVDYLVGTTTLEVFDENNDPVAPSTSGPVEIPDYETEPVFPLDPWSNSPSYTLLAGGSLEISFQARIKSDVLDNLLVNAVDDGCIPIENSGRLSPSRDSSFAFEDTFFDRVFACPPRCVSSFSHS